MRLGFKILCMIQSKTCLLMTFLLILALSSCDSSDNIPVQQVDSRDRLTDIELFQQQQQRQQQKQQQQQNTFYVGFDLRASPQEDVSQYLPFLRYLEDATGYHFKLHFTSKNSSTVEELGQNKSQFAVMGAVSFLKARSEYGAVPLVRGLNQQGKAEYQSVFVVRPDSSVRDIKDIKGRKLAFGSRDSTQGHLIPRIMLTENGISLNDLDTYGYTGSHQNCVEAVISGKYDVCGMQDQLAKELASQGLVKIIHSSRYYPSSGIVANQSVPAEIIARVKQALLDFDPQGKHSQGLYHWDRTEMPMGFATAKASDYADLRQWSIRLGFLQENYAQDQTQ